VHNEQDLIVPFACLLLPRPRSIGCQSEVGILKRRVPTAACSSVKSCSGWPPCSRRKNDEAQEGTSFKHPSGSRGCN
jgi:hypothetical protein